MNQPIATKISRGMAYDCLPSEAMQSKLEELSVAEAEFKQSLHVEVLTLLNKSLHEYKNLLATQSLLPTSLLESPSGMPNATTVPLIYEAKGQDKSEVITEVSNIPTAVEEIAQEAAKLDVPVKETTDQDMNDSLDTTKITIPSEIEFATLGTNHAKPMTGRRQRHKSGEAKAAKLERDLKSAQKNLKSAQSDLVAVRQEASRSKGQHALEISRLQRKLEEQSLKAEQQFKRSNTADNNLKEVRMENFSLRKAMENFEKENASLKKIKETLKTEYEVKLEKVTSENNLLQASLDDMDWRIFTKFNKLAEQLKNKGSTDLLRGLRIELAKSNGGGGGRPCLNCDESAELVEILQNQLQQLEWECKDMKPLLKYKKLPALIRRAQDCADHLKTMEKLRYGGNAVSQRLEFYTLLNWLWEAYENEEHTKFKKTPKYWLWLDRIEWLTVDIIELETTSQARSRIPHKPAFRSKDEHHMIRG